MASFHNIKERPSPDAQNLISVNFFVNCTCPKYHNRRRTFTAQEHTTWEDFFTSQPIRTQGFSILFKWDHMAVLTAAHGVN